MFWRWALELVSRPETLLKSWGEAGEVGVPRLAEHLLERRENLNVEKERHRCKVNFQVRYGIEAENETQGRTDAPCGKSRSDRPKVSSTCR